jgi:hypothetical protein
MFTDALVAVVVFVFLRPVLDPQRKIADVVRGAILSRPHFAQKLRNRIRSATERFARPGRRFGQENRRVCPCHCLPYERQKF